MGTARTALEAQDRMSATARGVEIEQLQRELERQRKEMEAQVAALRTDYERRADETARLLVQAQAREEVVAEDRSTMARLRRADSTAEKNGRAKRVRKGAK